MCSNRGSASPLGKDHLRLLHKDFKELIVDDTVIMFMIPLNGKLKTEQLLVIQKKKKDVHRATIEVTSQYKIVNTLVTYDNNEL